MDNIGPADVLSKEINMIFDVVPIISMQAIIQVLQVRNK